MKLDPKLPTDPRHYKGTCRLCVQAYRALGQGERHQWFAVVPHTYDRRAGSWRYTCPIGHEWASSCDQVGEYTLDCACLYCYTARRADGLAAWPGVPEYDQHSEAYRTLLAEVKDSAPYRALRAEVEQVTTARSAYRALRAKMNQHIQGYRELRELNR
jgi:hypothetical protein